MLGRWGVTMFGCESVGVRECDVLRVSGCQGVGVGSGVRLRSRVRLGVMVMVRVMFRARVMLGQGLRWGLGCALV